MKFYLMKISYNINSSFNRDMDELSDKSMKCKNKTFSTVLSHNHNFVKLFSAEIHERKALKYVFNWTVIFSFEIYLIIITFYNFNGFVDKGLNWKPLEVTLEVPFIKIKLIIIIVW